MSLSSFACRARDVGPRARVTDAGTRLPHALRKKILWLSSDEPRSEPPSSGSRRLEIGVTRASTLRRHIMTALYLAVLGRRTASQ